ncbi:MAG: hypothetical protein AAGJ35_10370, partial [Myxococcota bacterium]
KKVSKVSVHYSANVRNTCAILEDGSVRCWGNGYLGYGGISPQKKPSVRSIQLWGKKAKQVVMGTPATICVLLENRLVHCWGNVEHIPAFNAHFSLQGYGDLKKRLAPPVQALDFQGMGVLDIAMSGHACVLLEDGTVRCWGANASGQLGYGDRTVFRLKPGPSVRLGALKVKSIKVSSGHTCVLFEGGTMKCWGENQHGQLGYADTKIRRQPDTRLLDFQGHRVVQFSVGFRRTCAVLDDKSVRCWGYAFEERSLKALKTPLLVPLVEDPFLP